MTKPVSHAHHSGVVYYHISMRRDTGVTEVAPYSFQIGIRKLCVHGGEKPQIPTSIGILWTTPRVRCMKVVPRHNPRPQHEARA